MGGDDVADFKKKQQKHKSFKEIFKYSVDKALAGGITGMTAMAIQVFTLMWLRTTMNWQYRNGCNSRTALKLLYKEGGIPRFYRGLLPALIQGPLARFGDCFANAGTLAMLASFKATENLPIGAQTGVASLTAGAFRICLTPVDTIKTIMQVEGKQGIPVLLNKFKLNGPTVFFHGALATAAATAVGFLPWFWVYNWMSDYWKRPAKKLNRLGRNATIGFCSSCISDICSNSLRVIKTYRQTSKEKVSYVVAIRDIHSKEGLKGIFGRGLTTRIIAHGVNGIVFTVAWRYLEEEVWNKQPAKKEVKKEGPKEEKKPAVAASPSGLKKEEKKEPAAAASKH